jgi:hypothetical protein
MLATGYCINAGDIFSHYKKKLYKVKDKIIVKHFGGVGRDNVMGYIFAYGLMIILKDIILNNITFRFPTRTEAFIRVETVVGEDFIEARRRGAFADVDFLDSNYTGNELKYRYRLSKRWCEKKIYVSK